MIQKFHPDLQKKVKEYWPDFLYIYRTLYPNAGETDLFALIDIVNLAYSERKEALKRIDRSRENQRDWYLDQKWIATMFYVDLYAGNIKSIEEYLPYLKELGINYIHLMPLLETRKGPADGGYAVKDFRKVNPELGTNEDLLHLIEKMHQEDQIVAVDFVMNHTAKEHQWAQSVLKGEDTYASYYYLYPDRKLPDEFEKSLPEVFPDFAPGNFTYQKEINQWVWTTFNEYQWDLNYSQPVVFQAMLGEMLFLVNLGIDVLRLDAVPFLWKKMGTNCQNQEEAIMLLVAYKYLINLIAPGVLFKSEAIVAPNDIIRYLGSGGYEGKACEIGYHATLMNHLWHALACENTKLLNTTLSGLPPIPKSSTWINYLRCHDDIGWGISDQNAADVGQNGHDTRLFCSAFYTGKLSHSYAQGYSFQIDQVTGESRISGGTAALIGIQKSLIENKRKDLLQAIERFQLLHGVIFFMKGIPLVYAGDEVGHLNDFNYLKIDEKREDNRWLHRPRMDWEKVALRLKEDTIEHTLFHIISNLSRARKILPCLHGQAHEHIILTTNESTFCVEKKINGNQVLLLCNFSRKHQIIEKHQLPTEYQSDYFEDHISSRRISFPGEVFILPPYGIYWLSISSKTKISKKTYYLYPAAITIPGQSLYIVETKLTLGKEKNEKQIPCFWKPGIGWTVEIERCPGSWFSYQWVKMYGNQIIETSTDEFYLPQ
jgi:amylosucrase